MGSGTAGGRRAAEPPAAGAAPGEQARRSGRQQPRPTDCQRRSGARRAEAASQVPGEPQEPQSHGRRRERAGPLPRPRPRPRPETQRPAQAPPQRRRRSRRPAGGGSRGRAVPCRVRERRARRCGKAWVRGGSRRWHCGTAAAAARAARRDPEGRRGGRGEGRGRRAVGGASPRPGAGLPADSPAEWWCCVNGPVLPRPHRLGPGVGIPLVAHPSKHQPSICSMVLLVLSSPELVAQVVVLRY